MSQRAQPLGTDEMGGKDVGEAFGSNAGKQAVGQNGRREGSGGDVEKWYIVSV